MSKKKKKKPVISAKVQQAQKFNDFKKRLYLIAQACGAHNEFNMLPKSEIEFMFYARFKPFDLIAADGQQFTQKTYQLFKKIVNQSLKSETLTFINGGSEVDLYEYYYVGDTLRTAIKQLKNEKIKGIDKITKAFKPLLDKHEAPGGPHDRLFDISNLMASILSCIDKGYWLFYYHMVSRLKPKPEFYTCFKVEYVAPQILHITEGGNKRPVYRVGCTIFGQKVSWAQLTPQQLNIKSAFAKLKIDVYIQSHAMHRMEERLDCMFENIRHFFLFQSIEKFETVTNSRGQSFIAYYAGEAKLGYLAYEYIQGIVLIKTFLLLINNDTPEGEKLNKLLGLQKSDRQYLDLDKLSHFVKSDIPDNKELYNHFKEVGCTSLFEVNNTLFEQNVHENIHARQIEEYLNSADESGVYIETDKPN